MVWPENVEVSELWLAMDSQWRLNIGLQGAHWSAPDHCNLLAAIHAQGVTRKDRRFVFNALCDMEQAALAVLNGPE